VKCLKEEERELLLLIAAAHEPVDYDDLARVGVTHASPLHALLSRDLIALDPETMRYRLSIPSLEGALFQKTPLDEMQRIHGLWMESLKNEASSHTQKFHHALFLKDKALVTEGALSVAEFYRAPGDRSTALRLIQETLELIDDPIATSRLLRLK
jgi:hypothetical protein